MRHQESKKKFEKERKMISQNQGLKTILNGSTPKLPQTSVSSISLTPIRDFPTD